MKSIKDTKSKYPLGVWISIIALCLTSTAWIMQAVSLLNWDAAVDMGLQMNSFTGDALEQAMARKERGEAIADIIWVLPLNLVALTGLFKKQFYGFVTAMMVFAICIYFPLFYIFQIGNTHPETVWAAIILWAVPSAIGIIALWNKKKLFVL